MNAGRQSEYEVSAERISSDPPRTSGLLRVAVAAIVRVFNGQLLTGGIPVQSKVTEGDHDLSICWLMIWFRRVVGRLLNRLCLRLIVRRHVMRLVVGFRRCGHTFRG